MMLAQEECKLCIASIAGLELGVLGPEGSLLFRLVNMSSPRQAIYKALHHSHSNRIMHTGVRWAIVGQGESQR